MSLSRLSIQLKYSQSDYFMSLKGKKYLYCYGFKDNRVNSAVRVNQSNQSSDCGLD